MRRDGLCAHHLVDVRQGVHGVAGKGVVAGGYDGLIGEAKERLLLLPEVVQIPRLAQIDEPFFGSRIEEGSEGGFVVASVRDFVHDEAQERGWEGPGYGPGEEAHDAGTRPVAMWHKHGATRPALPH